MWKKILKLILYAIILVIIINLIGGLMVKYYFSFHGWKFVVPEKIPEKLVIISTETIENDSLLLYTYASQLNLFTHYMITKKETFDKFFFLKSMFYVDRSIKNNLVNTISKFLQNKDKFVLGLFPEGATRNIKKWKTGFHYIARNTKAEIGIVAIDHSTKSVFIDTIFKPTDDYEKDLKFIENRLRKYKPAIKERCNLFDKETNKKKEYSTIGLTPLSEIL